MSDNIESFRELELGEIRSFYGEDGVLLRTVKDCGEYVLHKYFDSDGEVRWGGLFPKRPVVSEQALIDHCKVSDPTHTVVDL